MIQAKQSPMGGCFLMFCGLRIRFERLRQSGGSY